MFESGLQTWIRRPDEGVLVRERVHPQTDQQLQHDLEGGVGGSRRQDCLGRVLHIQVTCRHHSRSTSSHIYVSELTARMTCTASGWEGTLAMPATVSPPTAAISSPLLTTTMTWHQNVVLVLQLMVEVGGSTGKRLEI